MLNSNKKVLIIAHNSFSKVSNNGKTLESMFGDFSKKNIAQVFFSENEDPDFDFCDNYFKITDSDVLKSLVKGNQDCGRQIKVKPVNENFNDINKSRPSLLFRLAKSKSDNLNFFRDMLWQFNSWKSPSFLRWIEAFSPDVIFYVGGNFGFSHKIARFSSTQFKVPLVTYFTDDYLIYPLNKNIFDAIQRKRMKNFYFKTVEQSSLCFAIGTAMANDYTAYFNKKFFPLMNSVAKQEYVPYLNRNNLTISYFGGLHLERWKMLVRFAKLLPSGVLNIYSIAKPEENVLEEFKKANIFFKGAVEGQNLKNAILDSDLLLHVESDDKYYRSLTKLSVSTKIPEYLISGRPIIGFGPIEVASMKILEDNKIGFAIDSKMNDDTIKLNLERIIKDFNLREKIGKIGHEFAVQNFDIEKISKEFKNKLEKL